MLQPVLRRSLGLAAAVAVVATASPALANSSAAADIAAPLRTTQAARSTPLGNGDEQFRNLFSSWQNQDRGIAAPVATVSIPSRMPLDGYRMSSSFGMRVHPVTGGRRAHKGIDMATPTGTPIRAAADGTVGKADWFGAYGLYVQLQHGGSIETRYGHMSRLNVAAGQRVRKGEIIGYVGSTGRSTGPHLHYEVRIAGEAVNPIPYMQSGEIPQAYAALASPVIGQGGPE
jgi:murein DD-endopeptidase MepM/ murein hydrolase activator NlpD